MQVKLRWHEFLVYFRNRPIPFLVLDVVRRFGDVVRVPGLGSFVHNPAIVKAILSDPVHFSNRQVGAVGAWLTQVLGDFALLNMDGPEHTKIKALLRDLFTEARLEALVGDKLREAVEGLRQRLERGDEVDISDFMHGLSSQMICLVVGIALSGPESDAEYRRIYRLIMQFTSVAGLGKKLLSEKEVAYATGVHQQLAAYTRRAYEASDLHELSILRALKDAGFSFDDVGGLLTIVLAGGTELITHAVPRILALLLDSGSFREVRQDPALLPNAIDEGLRYITPTDVMFRATTEDTTVAGYHFPKGTRIYIVFYAAMKHPEFFPSPRTFDIRRAIPKEVRHLWFGFGAHSCLGFFLAHKELSTIFRMLLGLNGELRITRRTYVRDMTFPAYDQFKVVLTPSRPSREPGGPVAARRESESSNRQE